MKVRANAVEPRILYLYAEDEEERKILDEMWKNGVVACTGGAGLVGICNKGFFGSGLQSLESTTKGDET